jgi:hypothetical protein
MAGVALAAGEARAAVLTTDSEKVAGAAGPVAAALEISMTAPATRTAQAAEERALRIDDTCRPPGISSQEWPKHWRAGSARSASGTNIAQNAAEGQGLDHLAGVFDQHGDRCVRGGPVDRGPGVSIILEAGAI